jgi:RNA polymerase sigma-70 factor (ECF subfamily)
MMDSPMVLDGNDLEVIAACQRGDYEAFGSLFEAYQDRVYSIALRFSGDRAAALDIAQETFLKLFLKIKDFRGDASFESWLYRLVVNSCLDQHRRTRKWVPFFEDFVDAFRSPGPSALQIMLREETRDHVQQAVAKLPADLRVVLVLRYTEGLSYEAIAEIVGCPEGTVASRLNRAHKLLEGRLAKYRGPGGSYA